MIEEEVSIQPSANQPMQHLEFGSTGF